LDTLAARDRAAISPDEGLVRRARTGDATAFNALVATRIDRCFRLAWSILNNEADAADATQEAFVSAWRDLPRLRDAAAFDGWLNRIVANAARMSRRHRVRLREVQVDPSPVSGERRDTAADQVAGKVIESVADNDAIGRAFDRMRADDRIILALHHVEERSVLEIARSLGIPVGTAKWRLHAARRALEKALEAES
jgi:RNA polymerase sigma-70 factor (ECF subfamily)